MTLRDRLNLPPQVCLGGSFDPPHVGHLIVSRLAAEAAGFNSVRLLPAGHSPMKAKSDRTAARLAMLAAATDGDDFFEVDDRETRRSGPSFTIDTATELQRVRPFDGRPVPWLVGTDLLAGLERWHRADELLAGNVLRFIVMRRGGYTLDWDALPPAVRLLRAAVVEVPVVELSSSLVRQRVGAGLGIQHMVPAGVEAIVEREGLYQNGEARPL